MLGTKVPNPSLMRCIKIFDLLYLPSSVAFLCILVLPLFLQLSTSLEVTKTYGLLVLAVVSLVNTRYL